MQEAKGSEQEVCSRTVLITGVSKGLGRALALEFARRGHTVIGCSRDQSKLDSLRTELSSFSSPDPGPDKHLLFNADVKSNNSVEELARAVSERKLVPGIIVNNAAVVNRRNEMWEIPVEDFDSVIDINIKGMANVLRHFIPLMISNKQGIIINMSSIAGRTECATFSAYCASKWAVEGLTKSIAKELPEGITIVALDPGVINTDMLAFSSGDLAASRYQLPEPWSLKAVPMILDLTAADNGASLTVDDLGAPLH